MKKSDVQRFETLMRSAEEANASHGYRRYYPIRSKDGNSIVFGVYDYGSKKYALSDPVLDNLSDICDEIEGMLTV